MIWNDYRVRGVHATQLKELKEGLGVPYYYDIYILAAIVGIENQLTAQVIDPESDSALIPGSKMTTEYDEMTYVYRLAMLMNEERNGVRLSKEERIAHAFKDDDNPEAFAENFHVMNSYVLGGIGKLYEEFSDHLRSEEDRMLSMYEYARGHATEAQLEALDE